MKRKEDVGRNPWDGNKNFKSSEQGFSQFSDATIFQKLFEYGF